MAQQHVSALTHAEAAVSSNGDDRIPGEDDVEDQGVSKRYRWVFSFL
jgi:hypothetical protein